MRAPLDISGLELRRFLRDRSNIFFVFVFPLLLVLVVGAQFSGDSGGRVAVDGPRGELRDAIARHLEAADVDVSYAGADDVREQLARGRVDVGLFIPAQAPAAFAAGEDIELAVVVGTEPAAPATAQRLQTAVQAVAVERGQLAALVAAGAAEPEAAAALARAQEAAAPVSVRVVDVNEISRQFAGVSGFEVGAAAQTLLFVFLASLAGSATLIQARRQGVMGRILAAPVTPRQAMAGQVLGRLAIAVFQGGYIMAATAVLFGVRWGSTWLALLVLVSFSLVASGAAMLIGSLMDNEGAASGVGVGLGLVLAALGGCMFPLELFPDRLATIAHLTPHAWAYEAFADVQRRGAGLADILPALGVLLAMATVVIVVGAAALRRSLARGL